MPRSMTGYGSAEGPAAGGQLAVEVRTVNHRHFSIQLKLPLGLQPHEAHLRARVRERLERGHVTLTARWSDRPPRPVEIKLNLEQARAVIDAMTELKGALQLPGDIDLSFVARQPDVLSVPENEDLTVDVTQLESLLDRALDEVVAMRSREGSALGADLDQRLAALERDLAAVEHRAPQRLAAERDRLREAVAELLDGKPLNDDRVSHEIAILADKLDISEECVRLKTHVEACRAALAGNGAVGRQLTFLGQEMLREINTIGSKANDAEITQTVVAMKGELEKFREQVENLE